MTQGKRVNDKKTLKTLNFTPEPVAARYQTTHGPVRPRGLGCTPMGKVPADKDKWKRTDGWMEDNLIIC